MSSPEPAGPAIVLQYGKRRHPGRRRPGPGAVPRYRAKEEPCDSAGAPSAHGADAARQPGARRSESGPLEFRYTRTDYLSARGTRYGRTTRAKIDLGGSVLVVVLGLLAFSVLGTYPAIGPYLLLLAPYLIGVGIGGLVLTVQHYGFSLRTMMGQEFPLGDEYTLGFDEQGLTLTGPHSTFHADWAHYVDVAETKRVYLLFWAPNVYTLIPRRVFPTPAVENKFRKVLQQKISGIVRFGG